jgi:hypothetical protein
LAAWAIKTVYLLELAHLRAMRLRAKRIGQLQAQRYYTRALGQLPYGPGAALVHAEGSRQGSGYEWSAAPDAAPMRRGHTCVELDEAGQIRPGRHRDRPLARRGADRCRLQNYPNTRRWISRR